MSNKSTMAKFANQNPNPAPKEPAPKVPLVVPRNVQPAALAAVDGLDSTLATGDLRPAPTAAAKVAKNKTECARCHELGCPSYGRHLTMAGLVTYRRCVACGWRFSVLQAHAGVGGERKNAESVHRLPPVASEIVPGSTPTVTSKRDATPDELKA